MSTDFSLQQRLSVLMDIYGNWVTLHDTVRTTVKAKRDVFSCILHIPCGVTCQTLLAKGIVIHTLW